MTIMDGIERQALVVVVWLILLLLVAAGLWGWIDGRKRD